MKNILTQQKYVGSTFQSLNNRLKDRKRSYRKWLRGNYDTDRKLFQNIFEYGWECFIIELLEEVEVQNKKHLLRVEGDWIKKLDTWKNGLNCQVAGRTKKQYRKDTRQQHYEREKKWNQDNKEWVSIRNGLTYAKNYKKYQKDKVTCECGLTLIRRNLKRHLLTLYHKKNSK